MDDNGRVRPEIGGVGIIRDMSDAPKPGSPVTSLSTMLTPSPAASNETPVVCERCGGPRVYRMHAVWRCADCGFKTDCCGW